MSYVWFTINTTCVGNENFNAGQYFCPLISWKNFEEEGTTTWIKIYNGIIN